MKKRANIFSKLYKSLRFSALWILHVLFLGSILSHLIPPSKLTWIAPLGFFFIYLVGLHLVLLIYHFKKSKTTSLICLILILGSAKFIPRTFNFNLEGKPVGLKVVSWNVKNFDLYNWTKNLQTRKMIMLKLDSLDADIICFQEFYTNNFEYNNLQLLKEMGYKHYAFCEAYRNGMDNRWGIAIFSKYPLSHSKEVPLHSGKNRMNSAFYSRVRFKEKDYHIYTAHFQSLHFDYQDYDYLQDIKREWTMVDQFKSIYLFKKIFRAYRGREAQVEKLLSNIPENQPRTILCTDLNDIPNSYAYGLLAKRFNDAFTAKGHGFSHTTNILFGTYRIDFIFTSEDMNISKYQRHETNLSDHHLVEAYLE